MVAPLSPAVVPVQSTLFGFGLREWICLRAKFQYLSLRGQLDREVRRVFSQILCQELSARAECKGGIITAIECLVSPHCKRRKAWTIYLAFLSSARDVLLAGTAFHSLGSVETLKYTSRLMCVQQCGMLNRFSCSSSGQRQAC